MQLKRNRTNAGEDKALRVLTWGGRVSRRAALGCLLLAMVGAAITAPAQRVTTGWPDKVTAVTANAYIGADLHDIVALDPTDPLYLQKLIQAVTVTYMGVVASDPPARLAGLAAEIAAMKPQVVAVQELTTVQHALMTFINGAPAPGPFTTQFDYTQLLLQALEAKGLHYTVAASAQHADITMPMMVTPDTVGYGRIIDHDAILVRTDSPITVTWSNAKWGHFSHNLQFQGITVLRGWCSIDLETPHQTTRVVCTHLEEETSPEIQAAQANELLAGLADVAMPVIIMGDMNADPLHRNGVATFDIFKEAGFKDTWSSVYSSKSTAGLTWGHDSFLADPSVAFKWRIDLVLYKGAHVSPIGIQVLDVKLNSEAAPLWPSDHGLVAAQFELGKKTPRGRGFGNRP